ncbi:MAG: polysaccharide deacetylase family protein [Chlamydiota bacterium]
MVGCKGKHANLYSLFKRHLHYIVNSYNVVLPGENLPLSKLGVCLTFDDATSDFYHLVYPLLQELHLQVMLGVPVESIGQPGFCSWEQLKEMVDSGRVKVASHSFSHANLAKEKCDLDREIIKSKDIIEKQLGQVVDTFIYPYGRFNQKAREKVLEHYRYAMRIGNAYNKGWHRELCRISGDNLECAKQPFLWPQQARYGMKFLVNVVRRKFFRSR